MFWGSLNKKMFLWDTLHMKVTSLTEIANQYGSDKGTSGPSFYYGGHNYTDIYEAYFCFSRLKEINVLEIGAGVSGENWRAYIAHGKNKQGGASIKMFYDYFPRANIYCIDINPATFLDNDRVKTFVIDQGKQVDLINFTSSIGDVKFDFIIDDGSHRPDHQQLSLSMLFPLLKEGGIYFIEDLEANGLNDPEYSRNNGRHKNTNVYNTRKLLKHFIKHSEFIKPNSLVNSEFLSKHISEINFHCPKSKGAFNKLFNRLVGKLLRKNGTALQFIPESESLVAIIKQSF